MPARTLWSILLAGYLAATASSAPATGNGPTSQRQHFTRSESRKESHYRTAADKRAAITGIPIHLTQSYYPPNADCWEYNIPVSVESQNIVFDLPEWADDFALQDFLQAATIRPTAENIPNPIAGERLERVDAILAASFCTPKQTEGRKNTIILATHGIGQARSHWNSAHRPEEFNFVQHAITQGYSVWFYDRLGQGLSTKVSGFTNQLRTQKAILVQLAALVKAGQFTGTFGVPEKLALIGYSFGSYVTHFAIAENPDIADAAIMTAVNYNTTGLNVNGLTRSFVPRVAAIQNTLKFGAFNAGYLTWVDAIAQINTYFKFPFYDVATIAYCELEKQPFGIGEFLTITDGQFDASGFRGAALAITGQPDHIICDGDCNGIFEEPARSLFPNAQFTPYLHPNAGHNFNFHANATGAYGVITDFLISNGL